MEETYIIGENKDTAIYIIGKHKDTAIYMIAENGKRTYMHGLNVFEFFNTHSKVGSDCFHFGYALYKGGYSSLYIK